MRIFATLILFLLCVQAIAQDQFHEIFQKKITFQANEMRLEDCLKSVCRQANVPLAYDPEVLQRAKVDLDRVISIELDNVTLSEAIANLLVVENKRRPYVLRGFWKGAVELTTLEARTQRTAALTPDWFGKQRPKFDSEGRITSVRILRDHDDAFLSRVLQLPAIERLEISYAQSISLKGIETIANCKTLKTVSLYQSGKPVNEECDWTCDDAVIAIAKSKTIVNLYVNQCGVSDAAMKCLPQMPALRRLNFEGNQLTDEGLKWLSECTNLTSLGLSGYPYSIKYKKPNFSNEGIQKLANLKNLEGLSLKGARFSAFKLKLPNLQRLMLNGTGISEIDIEMPHLQSLSLDDTKVSKLDLELPNLQSLNIGSNKIADTEVKKFTRYKRLQSLTLSSTAVTNEGIRSLTELPELTSLTLNCENVTGRGIFQLAKMQLTSVKLRGVQLTNLGLKGLAKIKTLKSLEISGGLTETTVAGFQQLKTLPELSRLSLPGFQTNDDYFGFSELKQLRTLSFDPGDLTKLNQEKLNELGKAMPNTQILAGNGARMLYSQSENH